MNSYALRGSLDTKTFEIKNLKLKGEAPVELRYNAYKSVNNDYSLNSFLLLLSSVRVTFVKRCIEDLDDK